MSNFMQSETWTDVEGNVWDIDAMLPSHRRNTLAFIRRQQDQIMLGLWRSMTRFLADTLDGIDPWSVDIRGLPDAEGMLGEFEDLPLVRALREAVERDEKESEERRDQPCY